MSPSNYLATVRARAAELALTLHSEQVTLEHMVCALLDDEESAVYELVEHAFADPETLYEDALALTPGILIVGSGATRPFSVRAVLAARAAVELARDAGLSRVNPACLLRAACAQLTPDALRALSEEGCGCEAVQLRGDAGELPQGTHLFHPFGDEARRALTSASRHIPKSDRRAISPVDLVVGALSEEPGLARSFGTSSSGASALLRPFAEDTETPEERLLHDDPALSQTFSALAGDGGSLALLGVILQEPDTELAQVFLRQKVTAALLERSLTSFVDP